MSKVFVDIIVVAIVGNAAVHSTAVLAYIFRSHRVTPEVILAAVTGYFLIAFSFATLYNIAFQFDFRSFRLPEWIDAGSS